MGFRDELGVFHPIRASKDYNEFLTTDVATAAERKRRAEEHDDRKRRARYFKEAQGEKQRKEQRTSLAQFVRRRGGIRPTEDLAGEVSRLSQRETGTSGLINRKAGRYNTPDYMREKANEAGYRNRDGHKFRTPAEFLEAVERDASGGRKFYVMANPARKKNAVHVSDLSGFSKSARAQIEREIEKSKKPATKAFKVSWFSTGSQKRVWFPRPVEAQTKSGAIAQVRGSLTKVRGVKAVNFIAEEVRLNNPMKKKNTAKKKNSSSKKSNGLLSAVKGAVKRRRARGKARRALTRELKAERRLQVARTKRTAAQRAAVSNPKTKKNVAHRKARIQIRSKTYHGKPGFLIVGRDSWGRQPRILVHTRKVAEAIKAVLLTDPLDKHDEISKLMLSERHSNPKQRNAAPAKRNTSKKKNTAKKAAKPNSSAKRKPNLTINVRETKIITRKKRARRSNTVSTDRLHSEFHGRAASGRTINGYLTPSNAPKDLSYLGPIVDIELGRGPFEKLVFNERLANAGRVTQAMLKAALRNPRAILCQAQRGPHRRLYVALREPYKRLPNGAPITRPMLLGEGAAVTYVARKPHLDDGKWHMYRHAYGDRGGAKPQFFINAAGAIDHRGGGYTVRAEGIDN